MAKSKGENCVGMELSDFITKTFLVAPPNPVTESRQYFFCSYDVSDV